MKKIIVSSLLATIVLTFGFGESAFAQAFTGCPASEVAEQDKALEALLEHNPNCALTEHGPPGL